MTGEEFNDPDPDPGFDPRDVDYASLVVGAFVATSGALFLVEPYVDPLVFVGIRARPIALSAVALAAGLAIGAAVYFRRGRRMVGIAHAIGGVGWGLAVAGTVVAEGLLLFAGFAVVIGGSLFLVAESRKL